MNGRMAKLIRAELAPREKLEELRDNERVSRGEFFRGTVEGNWGQVPKSTTNYKRIRLIYKRGEDGEFIEEDGQKLIVKATHALQYRLAECPRLAAKIIKRRVKWALQA